MNFIAQNIKYLRTQNNYNQDAFAKLFGNYTRDNIASYERGTEPKIGFMLSVVNYFHISLDDFVNRDLSIPVDTSEQKYENTSAVSVVNEPVQVQIVSNDDDMQPIPVMDIAVAAGSGMLNPDYISTLETIAVPKRMLKRNQLYYWVRAKGQSMSPGIQDNALILIRLLDRSEWAGLSKEPVVVVVHEGRATLKRIKNRLASKGFIVCMSDNPDKAQFPNFTLEEDEINTMWYAEANLGFGFPNIHTTYYSRLQNMEDELENIKHTLSIKGLLK